MNPGPESIVVFESWACLVRFVEEAVEVNEWAECSEYLHGGYMAVEVDGLPRVIDGKVH
jgi:hypothetical protein